MNVFRKLERKFGKYAIRDLMKYIVYIYIAGLILQFFAPSVYYNWLCLDAYAILHGQIWRVVTFLLWPPISVSAYGMTSAAGIFNTVINLLFNGVLLYCYWTIGLTLERAWGSFMFNMYFLIGIIGHVLAVIIIYLAFGYRYILTTDYINLALFFAIAFTYPDTQFLLMMAIPIKAKWLALFDAAIYVYGFITGTAASRVAIVLSLLNVFIFFLLVRGSRYSPREVKRKRDFKAKTAEPTRIDPSGAHHRCMVCGRTDVTNPELQFRFCSKCEGNCEYCSDHLYTHQHVTRQGMDPRQGT